MRYFANFKNVLNTWAVEARGLSYNKGQMRTDFSYPAIIDTGSSQIAIPPAVFEQLKSEWAKAEPRLNCHGHDVFCYVDTSCAELNGKLKPVAFRLENTMFEIPPEEYLFVSSPEKCFIKLHKCNLPPEQQNIFLMGDLLLKHFYSSYDFDKDQIGLGLNTHSKDTKV